MHECEPTGTTPRIRTQLSSRVIRISESMPLEFLDPSCTDVRLDADFLYESADPFAVTVVFRSGDQEVRWTFGRELLVQGLHEPVGVGDVQLWPCLNEAGFAVVVIELSSPDGAVLVQASSRSVARFVHRMLTAVPLGEEGDLVDLDAALAALLR